MWVRFGIRIRNQIPLRNIAKYPRGLWNGVLSVTISNRVVWSPIPQASPLDVCPPEPSRPCPPSLFRSRPRLGSYSGSLGSTRGSHPTAYRLAYLLGTDSVSDTLLERGANGLTGPTPNAQPPLPSAPLPPDPGPAPPWLGRPGMSNPRLNRGGARRIPPNRVSCCECHAVLGGLSDEAIPRLGVRRSGASRMQFPFRNVTFIRERAISGWRGMKEGRREGG
jgi:hypothetical protein